MRQAMAVFWIAACIGTMPMGCVRMPQKPGMADVQQDVAARTGRQVYWNTGSEEDHAIESQVHQLLNQPLTADACVQVALLNNARLQGVYEDLAVSQAAAVQAGLLSNPIFEAAARFPLNGGPTELEFSVVQNFLQIFTIPLRRGIAESEFAAAKLRVAAAVMDMALQTRLAFYRYVAAEQLLELNQQVLQATEASLTLAQELHQAGNITELHLLREQSLHEQSKWAAAHAEQLRDEFRESLTEIMGLWGQTTQWRAVDRLTDADDPAVDWENVERRAVHESLELAMARQEMETAGRRLGWTRRTALLPELEAGITAERSDGHWEMGPTIALPIPLLDQGQARTAVGQAELRRSRQEYLAQAVEVRSAARAARQRYLAARQMAEYARTTLLPLATRLVESAQLQYNAGQISPFELIAAKQQQIDAGRRYIESLRDYWIARAVLDQILHGRLPASKFDTSIERSATSPSPLTPSEGH